MLSKMLLGDVTNTSVDFYKMCEHPGGADGGEYKQKHVFTIAEPGVVTHLTSWPDTVNSDFDEEDQEAYSWPRTKGQAKRCLLAQLADLKQAVMTVELILSELETAKFETVFDDGSESEDEE